MLGVDPDFGTSVLHLWVAAGSAALLLFCVLALFQPQLGIAATPARRASFVIAGAALGAAMTWAFLDRTAWCDRGAERRALELRAEQLTAQVLAPGSPLACLDASAGESVEAACEKALFVSPASVASASSYVAARLTLLSSMVAYVARGGADIDDVLSPWRRSLEADRFGFVAHVLAVRDGCTSENCKAFALLRDANRIRTNLSVERLDHLLERYAALCTAGPEGAVADAAQAQSNATPSANAQGARKMVNIDFPSAASIPAVSIMNAEPTGPVLPGAAAAAASNPNPSSAGQPVSRHSRKQTANPPVPAAAPGAAAVEPVWPEPVPAPPPASSAQPASAPVQLSPPAPNASAGAAVRTQ